MLRISKLIYCFWQVLDEYIEAWPRKSKPILIALHSSRKCKLDSCEIFNVISYTCSLGLTCATVSLDKTTHDFMQSAFERARHCPSATCIGARASMWCVSVLKLCFESNWSSLTFSEPCICNPPPVQQLQQENRRLFVCHTVLLRDHAHPTNDMSTAATVS